MPLITLLTDFGLRDEYVGVMKGVIAGIAPRARVVDITHAIDPQDVVHGAFILAAAYAYFPVGSIHLAVVDPGVGGARRIIAVECAGHRFVAPDNGLLERVLDGHADIRVVAVENRRYFLAQVSQTFHGRDIFAPVGAHLANGLPLIRLGSGVGRNTLAAGVVPRCKLADAGRIEGRVVAVDRFGNLMTNIDAGTLRGLTRGATTDRVVVELAGARIDGIATSYGQVARNAPLSIWGSRGLLEISVNQGDAARILGVGKGDGVRVMLK